MILWFHQVSRREEYWRGIWRLLCLNDMPGLADLTCTRFTHQDRVVPQRRMLFTTELHAAWVILIMNWNNLFEDFVVIWRPWKFPLWLQFCLIQLSSLLILPPLSQTWPRNWPLFSHVLLQILVFIYYHYYLSIYYHYNYYTFYIDFCNTCHQ